MSGERRGVHRQRIVLSGKMVLTPREPHQIGEKSPVGISRKSGCKIIVSLGGRLEMKYDLERDGIILHT